MQNTLFVNFRRYFPLDAESTVEYHQHGDHGLVALLSNGRRIMYDDLYKTIRSLPVDSSAMSESECRKEFGYRLRDIMARKKITQSELAAMTGIAQPTISNYVAGKAMPSFYAVDRIAKALDCSIEELRYTE